MDRAGADRLAQMLATHGYNAAGADTVRVGRVDYLAVSAVNPKTV